MLLKGIDTAVQDTGRLEIHDDFSVGKGRQGDGTDQVVASGRSADGSSHVFNPGESHQFPSDAVQIGLYARHEHVLEERRALHIQLIVLHIGEKAPGHQGETQAGKGKEKHHNPHGLPAVDKGIIKCPGQPLMRPAGLRLSSR